MKKLFINIFLLSLLVTVTCLTVFAVRIPDDEEYVLANADKLQLLQKSDSPRIILVGASNLAFGIDSSMIQSALGYDVINMGVHAGLGFRFLLNEVKPYIKKGDIVVLIPEYQFFYGYFNGKKELLNLINLSHDKYKYLSPIQYAVLLKYLPEVSGDKIQLVLKNILDLDIERKIYNRYGFNELGDLTTHKNAKSPRLSVPKTFLVEKNQTDIAVVCLNEFYEFCRNKEISVFISFPPYPQEADDKSKLMFKELYIELSTKTPIPVISIPDNYYFPLEDFFDTFYHLNWEGKKERTRILIHDLNSILKPYKPSNS